MPGLSQRWAPEEVQDIWQNREYDGKIRNSTAEFLTFVAEGKEQGIQVLYKDETVWATQKAMALLFDCSADNIGLHLKNIFKSGELDEDSVTDKISATAADGKKEQKTYFCPWFYWLWWHSIGIGANNEQLYISPKGGNIPL